MADKESGIGRLEEVSFWPRETPPTQNGIVPDFPTDVGQQSTRITADEVLMSDGDVSTGDRGETPVAPEGGATDGYGSLGSDVDGWHPQADRG